MTFANCFYTDMTASANRAEAPFACADFASNKAIALILDAVIAASIIIVPITITLLLGLSVLLLAVVLVRLVLVVLLVLEEVNRRRRHWTA